MSFTVSFTVSRNYSNTFQHPFLSDPIRSMSSDSLSSLIFLIVVLLLIPNLSAISSIVIVEFDFIHSTIFCFKSSSFSI